ncbi:MAG: hypothetical protein K2N87_14045, partial [Eubacterium sp.]|nr:hypothetical protein [Eubacterium sp.]
MRKNDFMKCIHTIPTMQKARKHLPGIFAAAALVFSMKSDALGAKLPETHAEEQVPESTQANQQIYGWQNLDGQKYYFYPETGQMATGWLEIDGESYY